MPDIIRQRLDGPPLTRAAEIDATSIDSDARRVRVSFSSDHPVTRESWFDDAWIEILGHNDGEVELDRANAGAPVLYNHSRYDSAKRLGRIERAWIENGRGYADLLFSKREEVDGYWRDIADGILTSVSVGYRIKERTLLASHADAPNEYRVTQWEPHEISLVDIPADYTVGVGRSHPSDDRPSPHFRITDLPETLSTGSTREANAMPDGNHVAQPEPTETRQQPQTPRPADPVNLDDVRTQARREALAQERARRAEIHTFCNAIRGKVDGLEPLEQRAMDTDMSLDQLRAAILEKMAEGAAPVATDPETAGRAVPGEDERDKLRAAGADACIARAGIREIADTTDPSQRRRIDLNGNPFRGATLLQIAERCLRSVGINPDGMDKRELVGRAFQTTSDFPVLLENAIHKTLLSAYRLQPDTWSRFCKTGSVSDFRAHNRYRTGSIGNYDALTEHGEYVRKAIPDGEKSSITASTRGNIIGVTRETIINDDLGALTDLAANLGRAGRRTIEAAVYTALAENGGAGPTLNDGKALFHTDHGNLAGTGAVPSVTTIDAARVAMAQQKDVTGNDYLDLRPALWLGPMGLGGDVRVINDAQYDPDTANKMQRPNKVRGLLSDIVDTPRLSGAPWMLFADPMEAAALEVAFLDGEQEPYIETQDGWDVDGAEIKARLDFGVAGIDYRGAYRNPGE